MMRIAIAGSGGLARIFAQYITETVHPFIILSREVSYRDSTKLVESKVVVNAS